MKNKILLLATITVVLVSGMQVFALNQSNYKYYTNKNGITLTQKEMDFVNQFYGKNFFDKMTLEDYEWIEDLNINTNDISIETYYDSSLSSNDIDKRKSTSHATNYKKISIAKSCSNVCTIITDVEWYINPSIRSYDIIGYRFVNTSLTSNVITTKVSSSIGTTYFSNNKIFQNGVGCSIKLPDNATNIMVQQKIYTTANGHVYASYQHATSNITLDISKQYTIGTSVGNVFSLYGSAVGKFDQMGGVDIEL